MLPLGHDTITRNAQRNFRFPFYTASWLPNEMPGAAVQADQYLFNDPYAHFMKGDQQTDRQGYRLSLMWIRMLALYATKSLFKFREELKISKGSESAWGEGGLVGRETRNTQASLPSWSPPPESRVTSNALWSPSGDASFDHIQKVMDRIRCDGLPSTVSPHGSGVTIQIPGKSIGSPKTYQISYAMGFALHAIQDSYTARHAERAQMYSGPIARLYEWSTVRDFHLAVSYVDTYRPSKIIGTPCNGYLVMSHHDSDLIDNWYLCQRNMAINACRNLVLIVMKTADLAANPLDLAKQFSARWQWFESYYLRATLDEERLGHRLPTEIDQKLPSPSPGPSPSPKGPRRTPPY